MIFFDSLVNFKKCEVTLDSNWNYTLACGGGYFKGLREWPFMQRKLISALSVLSFFAAIKLLLN